MVSRWPGRQEIQKVVNLLNIAIWIRSCDLYDSTGQEGEEDLPIFV